MAQIVFKITAPGGSNVYNTRTGWLNSSFFKNALRGSVGCTQFFCFNPI
jgi:hypothetical protein